MSGDAPEAGELPAEDPAALAAAPLPAPDAATPDQPAAGEAAVETAAAGGPPAGETAVAGGPPAAGSRPEPPARRSAARARAPKPAPAAPSPPAPTAFFAVERGTATLAVSLIGRAGARWRLLATTALPAGAAAASVRRLLVERVAAAEPGYARGASPDLPVLAAEGRPAPTLLVVSGSERTRTRAAAAASGAGWRVASAGSAQRADPLALTFAGTRPGIRAVLAAINDPPDSDERDLAGEVSVVAAGIAARRRDVPLLLAGPLPFEPARNVAHGLRIVPVPAPAAGTPPGEPLRAVLLDERAGASATRRALVAAAGSLARVLDLRVELLEIGFSGGLRVRADPVADAGAAGRGRTITLTSNKGKGDQKRPTPPPTPHVPDPTEQHAVRVRSMEVPEAALFWLDDPAAFDRLETWTTLSLDRARLRDRISELGLLPWADLDGEGAILRAAALRAALDRLLAATDPVLGTDAPDLAVGVGGAWSAMPGPAAAHVLADTLRRPGAVQLATDHARLLAPLGTIEDDGERDAVLADLLDDLLLPLGTVITPKGLRPNRSAGRLSLTSGGGRSDVDMVAGGIALVDLPPGVQGEAELAFKNTVELGPKGRRFAIAVSGGLAGLVVDLRDIPLRLPERPDRRREVLTSWERALWPERDS